MEMRKGNEAPPTTTSFLAFSVAYPDRMLLGCWFPAQLGTGTLVVPVLASISILGSTASTSAVLVGLLTPEPSPLFPLTYPLPSNSLTFCTHSPAKILL